MNIINKKISAFFIDYCILFVPTVIAASFVMMKVYNETEVGLYIFTATFILLMPFIVFNFTIIEGIKMLLSAYITFLLIYIIYSIISQIIFGKTIGQHSERIKIINLNKEKSIFFQIIKRNVLKIISIILFPIEIMYYKKNKTFLYEDISNTKTIFINE